MTRFPLRVPDDMMEQAKVAADEDRMSLDQLMLSLIADGLQQREGLKMMRARARRADQQRALAILDRIEGLPPEAGDEMPR